MIFKQIKIFKKKGNQHFLLLSFVILCLTIVVLKHYITSQKDIKNSRQISSVEEILNPQIVPAGTPLMTPPWMQQQYLQHIAVNQALLGNRSLLDFLIHNYSVAAPSSLDESEDTYYVPLLRSSYLDDEDSDYDEDDDYSSLTEYFDVTNLSLDEESDPNAPTFRTKQREDTQKNRAQIPEAALRKKPLPAKPPAPEVEPVEQPTTSEEKAPEESNPNDLSPIQTEESTATEPAEKLEDTPAEESENKSTKESPKKDYESRGCHRSSQAEETTEAVSICTECSSNKTEIIRGLKKVVDTVKAQQRQKRGFGAVLKNFCSTCQPVDIEEFIQYVNDRAYTEKMPPAIFFSLMMQESNGKCDASNTSGGDNSFGLLQLNTNSAGSTCLNRCSNANLSNTSSEELKNVCRNGTYRAGRNCKRKKDNSCINCQNSNQPLICLNNPYCNFEESLHLMKEKWQIGNKRTSRPTELHWLDMNSHERNLWRNAIISYNGAGYMKKAEGEMQKSGVSNTDDWEQKRLYFIKKNWLNQSSNRQNQVIHNLAYVERITGREIPCGGENSIMVEWLKFIETNPSPSCVIVNDKKLL